MIEYFPKDTAREGWWDIAHNGKRVGYIIKDGHFFEVTVNKSWSQVGEDLHEAWTTMEAVKKRVEETLGDIEEKGSELWAEIID